MKGIDSRLSRIPDRFRGGIVCATGLFLAGVCAQPFEKPVWSFTKENIPELSNRVEGALGQGLIMALLGGFRANTANFLWIRTNYHWEQKDMIATESMIALTTEIDPRPDVFWINGARIISYDVPIWRMRERSPDIYDLPESERREVFREQAEKAFALLDRARQFHPEDPRYVLERANILLNKLEAKEAALPYFKRAYEMGSPNYAGRIHGELLRDLGRHREALEWYRHLFMTTSANNIYARKNVLLERIGEIEQTLGMVPHELIRWYEEAIATLPGESAFEQAELAALRDRLAYLRQAAGR